jgi:predicted ATPase
LDDLVRLFGDLPLSAPAPLGDPALEKTRLFEAVAHLLARLARDSPAVLFVDDLQWVDSTSLEVLHYLARGLPKQPVLLLGTYRADEPERETVPKLRGLLHSLRRLQLATELSLDRLTRDDVLALASGTLGGEPARELVDALAERAGGTPLFVEALLRDLVESGQVVRTEAGGDLRTKNWRAPPPAAVRDVILERLRRLDPTPRW